MWKKSFLLPEIPVWIFFPPSAVGDGKRRYAMAVSALPIFGQAGKGGKYGTMEGLEGVFET